MENKVLTLNLGELRRYDTSLVETLLKTNVSSALELSKTQKDEYNLVFNSKELHSYFGAQDEAKKIVKGIPGLDKQDSICVLFGLGLGYLLDEVSRVASGKVVLYEPSLDILKATLEMVELKDALGHENVFVCASIDKLREYIKTFANKETEITISFLTSYRELFSNKLNEVAKCVEYTHGEGQAYENTMNSIANLAALNTFKNIFAIKDSCFINELKGRFENETALVVSAGPSLSKNIEVIKNIKDKVLIFAVGPALKLLLENDIKPDFLCVIEPQSTKGQLDGFDLSDINLIIEPFTHSILWETPSKNKFLFPSRGSFLNDWLCRLLKISNDELFSCGTVSYCALLSARLMGCSRIISVGQDLAYSDKRCYAKGSAYSQLVCELDCATQKYKIFPKDYELYKKELYANQPPDMVDACVDGYLDFLNKNLCTVVGQSGEPLPTQSGYALFIKHFESFAQRHSNLELINASIGGAQINGYENLPLESISFNEPLDKSFEEMKSEYDFSAIEREFLKTKTAINESITIFESFLEVVQKIQKEFRPKNIEKLKEKVHSELAKYGEHYFQKFPPIYFLLYRVYNAFLKLSESSTYLRECQEELKILNTIIEGYLSQTQDALHK